MMKELLRKLWEWRVWCPAENICQPAVENILPIGDNWHAPAWLLLYLTGMSERCQLRRRSTSFTRVRWYVKCFYSFFTRRMQIEQHCICSPATAVKISLVIFLKLNRSFCSIVFVCRHCHPQDRSEKTSQLQKKRDGSCFVLVSVLLERHADRVSRLWRDVVVAVVCLTVKFCCGKFNSSFDNRHVKRSRHAIAQKLMNRCISAAENKSYRNLPLNLYCELISLSINY